MIKKERLRCRVIVRNDDFIVRDHRVYGIRIMPGVTFIDLLYRVVIENGASPGNIELKNILFPEAVVTSDSFDREIKMFLQKTDGSWKISAKSRKIRGKKILDEKWSENFSCELVENSDPMSKSIDIEELKRKAVNTVDMEEIYASARLLNVVHYDFMKSCGRWYIGDDYVLSEIHLNELAKKYLESFYLHPVYLDSSTLCPLYFQMKSTTRPYIPFFIESFRASCRPGEVCFVYAQKGRIIGSSDDILSNDYELYGPDGRIVASFRKFSSKKIRFEESIGILGGGSSVHQGRDEREEQILHDSEDERTAPETESRHPGVEPDIHGETSPPLQREAVEEYLRAVIQGAYGHPVDESDSQKGFYDLGLDSSHLLVIVRKLESELKTQLYPTLLFEYSTIDQLAGYLLKEFDDELAEKLISGKKDTATAGGDEKPLLILYYSPVWEKAPIEREGSGQRPAGPILVLDNDELLLKSMRERLKGDAPRSRAVLAKPGKEYRELDDLLFQVDPGKREDYEKLFERLGEHELLPRAIVHNWFNAMGEDLDQTPQSRLERGIFSLFTLSQLLTNYRPKTSIRIICFYQEACDLSQAYHGAVSGFAKTLLLENPRLMCKAVGYEKTASPRFAANELSDMVLRELQVFDGHEIRYRSGMRWRKQLRRIDFSSEEQDEKQDKGLFLREGGVYLITGGLGGLGTIFSEYLARRKKARLILAGRSEKNLKIERKIHKLESLGAEVLYVKADVSKKEDAERLIARGKSRFKKIHGIIHAAGLLHDSLLLNKKEQDIESVVAPKVYGSLHLDAATEAENLDFFVLFSSTTSMLGNIGQSGYAYANSFMDHFAHLREGLNREKRRFGKTVSINWPLWKKGGMKSDEQSSAWMAQKAGFAPLENAEGFKAFEESLRLPYAQLMVLKGQEERIESIVRAAQEIDAKGLRVEGSRAEMGRGLGMKGEERRIAIVGLSGRYPMARSLDEFWENLRSGRDCIEEIPAERWDYRAYFDEEKGKVGKTYSKWGGFIRDVDSFDPLFFNISPKDARFMDPQERLFLEISWQTVEDAGYTREYLEKERVGVFVGVMWGQYQLLKADVDGHEMTPMSSYGSIANRVSYYLDLNGPSLAIDTMCSSSLMAIHLACESIEKGESSLAIAGGVNLTLHPSKYIQLSQKGFLSTDGRCRSFGDGGDGYVPGEGVGAVLLKPLERAREDGDHIYGVIVGSSANHSGRTSGYSVPDPKAQREVVEEALQKSKIDPRTVGYIEAHGTGTSLGDPIEIAGLSAVFKKYTREKQYCSIGSVKSNIGHLESAAGIASVTKVLLQMKHKQLVPSIHSERLNANIDFSGSPFYVQQKPTDWEKPVLAKDGEEKRYPRRAGISSFGAGGANVHLVIEEYEGEDIAANLHSQSDRIVPLSAKNRERLESYAREMAVFLGNISGIGQDKMEESSYGRLRDIDLTNLAYTLQVGREAFDERLAVVISSMEQLREKLTAYSQGERQIEDIYSGNVRTDRKELNLFVEGEEAEKPLREAAESRNLKETARRWIFGEKIDWGLLYRDQKPKRISLPTYPFARERYWISQSSSEKEQDSIQLMYYCTEWHKSTHEKGAKQASLDREGVVLFFVQNGKMCEDLQKRLSGREEEKTRAVFIEPGEMFHEEGRNRYELNPADQKDYYRLIESLFSKNLIPSQVIHMWCYEGCEGSLEDQMNRGLYSLLFLCQALMTDGRHHGVQILFVYSIRDERLVPHHAAVSGFARTVHVENPYIRCKVIEIWKDSDPLSHHSLSQVWDTLLQELETEDDGAVEVRYQRGARWVKELKELEPSDQGRDDPLLREGGVYLISGGAGGLGFIFAKYLANRFRTNLVLAGRSDLNSKISERIEELESSGSEVLYCRSDVSKSEDVRNLIREAKKRFGRIHGIFHAAGTLSDSFLLNKTREEMESVVAPKLSGTLNLDEMTSNEPLDFFVMFSSVSAVFGNSGQSGYAYANSFMDNFAQVREGMRAEKKRHGKTVSINWQLWEEGGMKIPEEELLTMSETSGAKPLPSEKGMTAWEACLRSDASQCMVIYGKPEKTRRFLRRRWMSSSRVTTSSREKEEMFTDRNFLFARTESLLKDTIGKELQLSPERIDSHLSFGEYGIDSITVRRFGAKMEERFGPLPKTLLLEYENIHDLADYFVANHESELLELFGLQASSRSSQEDALADAQPEKAPSLRTRHTRPERGRSITERANEHRQIAIVGMSGRFPGASNIQEYWNNLKSGKRCITEVPYERWDWQKYFDPDPQKAEEGKIYCNRGGFLDDVDKFDPLLFNLTPLEAGMMNPEDRLMLEVVWETLENAAYTRADFEDMRVGVFVGITTNTYSLLGIDEWAKGRYSDLNTSSYQLPNRISFFFNFTGPSIAIDTACSSSLAAIHMACESIRSGECDAAVAGGVNLYMHFSKYLLMCKSRMLSTKGTCDMYASGGNGFIPGEGAGAVLLKPLKAAIDDHDHIYGIVAGSVVSHKGRSAGFSLPSPRSQAALIRDTLSKAGVDIQTIGYIETQALGSEMVDHVEWTSLNHAFKEFNKSNNRCCISSVKPNIGHLEAASGMAQLIKVLLQLKHCQLVPTLVGRELSPQIDPDNSPFYMNESLRQWSRPCADSAEGKVRFPRRAGINSFGAGGADVHLLIEEYASDSVTVPRENGGNEEELVLFSAKTTAELEQSVMRVRDYLYGAATQERGPSVSAPLGDIAYTLQVGREALEERLAVVVRSKEELLEALDGFLHKRGISQPYWTGRAKNRSTGKRGFDKSLSEAYEQHNLKKAAELWVQGAAIDFKELAQHKHRRRVPLPTYPFEKRRCWMFEQSSSSLHSIKEIDESRLHSREDSCLHSEEGKEKAVEEYYNSMTPDLEGFETENQEEACLIFAPFAHKVDGFSWLRTIAEPEKQRVHHEWVVKKQKEMKRVLYRSIDFHKVRRVLDIGCGLCTDLLELAHTHPHIHGDGYTISPRQAEWGAWRVKKAGMDDRLRVFCRDSSADPFPDMYDLIIGFEVTFHIKDKQGLFSNISEHLRQGGYVALADVVANTVTEVNMPQVGQYTPTRSQFGELLAHGGLCIEDCIDVSREIANYLFDPGFEENLKYVHTLYPELQRYEEVHRGWDNFGKALTMDLFQYLLLTLKKAEAGLSQAALSEMNMEKLKHCLSYRDLLSREPLVESSRRAGDERFEESRAIQDQKEHLEALGGGAMSVERLSVEVERRIKRIVCTVLKMKDQDIDVDSRFADFGINSLLALKVVDTVNRELDLKVKIESLFSYSSIRDMSRYLSTTYRDALLEKVGEASKEKRPVSKASDMPAPERLLHGGSAWKRQLETVHRDYTSIDLRESVDRADVAIVGVSVRLPGAKNPREFWKNLENGVDSVTEIPRDRWDMKSYFSPDPKSRYRSYSKWGAFIEDVYDFDPRFFEIAPSEAEVMDPHQRLFLEECWHALEDAGYSPGSLSSMRCGVYVGIMNAAHELPDRGRHDNSQVGKYMIGNSNAILASRIGYFLNLKGPAVSIDTACSSSLVAVHLACKSLQERTTEMMLAGGVTLYLSELPFITMSKAGMLSPTGRCRTFDESADGTTVGEGVGVVVLKLLDRAVADGDHIYGVIKGSGMNQDGKSNGITAPCGESQKELEIEVYEKGGINPETISYVEAHGTGTKLGDPIEVAALTDAFQRFTDKRQYCAIGSVKSNIGHTSAASGVVSLIKVLLSFEHRAIPSTLHVKRENVHIDFAKSPFYVNKTLRKWERGGDFPRRAAISAFGFSGTNCHMVVEEPPESIREPQSGFAPGCVVPLSAKDSDRLKEYAHDLLEFLEEQTSKRKTVENRVVERLRRDIRRIVSDILQVDEDEISYEESFEEYGFDPVTLSNLVEQINEEYTLQISPDIVSEYPSIRLFAHHLIENWEPVLRRSYGNTSGAMCHETDGQESLDILDVAYTLQEGREAMEERMALVAGSMEELAEGLRKYCEGGSGGWYRGNAKRDRGRVGMVVEGEEGLEKVAEAWVCGAEVEWGRMYGGREPRRISLPTYPFARKRYWAERRRVRREEDRGREHPLIGENISSLREQRYRRRIGGEEFYVRDHEVGGEKVVPGVVYIEMARAAGELAGEGEVVRRIRDMVWVEPMVIGGEGREVRIRLRPKGRGVRFEVITEGGGGGGRRGVHAQGRIEYGERGEEGRRRVDIGGVKEGCGERIGGDELYEAYRRGGIEYGESFRVIRELYYGGGEAISYMELPEGAGGGGGEYRLHPSIMDGALQTVVGIWKGEEGRGEGIYVPFGMELVEIEGEVGRRCYAHARRGGGGRYDIEILDEEGERVVRMEGFRVRELGGKKGRKGRGRSDVVYYRSRWERRRGGEVGKEGIGRVLVFGSEEEAEEIGRYGEVVVVRAGGGYRDTGEGVYEIDPKEGGDYERLVEALEGVGKLPERVVHTWSVEGVGGRSREERIRWGLYSIYYISRALMRRKIGHRVEIVYVYGVGEGEVIPEYGGVVGFGRVLGVENRGFGFKAVEIVRGGESCGRLGSEEIGYIVGECGGVGGIEVRYEGGERWERVIEEVEMRGGEGGKIREGGVYVISGGLGGLGKIFGEYLSKEGKAKVVLVGRREVSKEEAEEIGELGVGGGEVVYERCDIRRREEVEGMIERVKGRYGRINGILHGAGVIRDALIVKKREEEIEEVLGPKVYGTVNLDEVTKGEGLDFFVMFSSAAAMIGNGGQSDYGYANSYMDRYAEGRERLRGKEEREGKTVTINWGLWGEGGMRVGEEVKELMERVLGMGEITRRGGLEAFKKVLGGEEVQYMVLEGEREKIRRRLGGEERSRGEEEERGEGIGIEEMRGKVRGEVVGIVSEILKIEAGEIDVGEEMDGYGFDSIMLTELANRVNERFGVEITPAVFFELEEGTIEGFVGYLVREEREGVKRHYGVGVKGEEREEREEEGYGEGRFLGEVEGEEERNGGVVEEGIAIVGMSGVMPGSKELEVFWEHLEKGEDLISEVPEEREELVEWRKGGRGGEGKYVRWGGFMGGVDRFDPLFFGISPREAELMDPQQRIFLETVWKSIEDAGYKASELSGTKTGIFVGVGNQDYGELLRKYGVEVDAHALTGVAHSMVANRISYILNLHGPSEPIDTACSSSLVAVHRAVEAIRSGRCEMAIAGGVNVLLSPTAYISFGKAGMLSEDGRCKSFDEGANGYVRGEGSGAILLKPVRRAIEEGDHIYGVIRGTAVNHGGHGKSLTAPNVGAQAELLMSAYEDAGIDMRTVSYLEAHGTGTSIGDPVEVKGIKRAMSEWGKRKGEEEWGGEVRCGIGSVKTNIGHLETAAGIAGLIKVVLAMKHKKLPRNVHFRKLNPYIELEGSGFYIVEETEAWERRRDGRGEEIPRRAGVSSYGFGGANAHVVVEEYRGEEEGVGGGEEGRAEVVVISARDEGRLREYAEEMLRYMEKERGGGRGILRRIAYTLQEGREAMEERMALVAGSMEELAEGLIQYLQGKTDGSVVYTSNIKAEKNKLDLLVKGRAGEEFLKLIFEEKDLKRIAQLWLAGVDINWKLLHSSQIPKRIPLPTYPFAREKYWIPASGKRSRKQIDQIKYKPKLHPLIDENESTLEGLDFKTRIMDENFFVTSLKIDRERSMPNTVFLEMARAAGDLVNRTSRVRKLQNISWPEPLMLHELPVELRTSLCPDKDRVKYRVFSTQEKNLGPSHAQGELVYADSGKPKTKKEKLDIEAIKERCSHLMTSESCYGTVQAKGLEYGQALQSIREVHQGETELLALLQLPLDIEEGFNNYELHPAIMEAGIQSMMIMNETDSRVDASYFRLTIKEVEIIDPLPKTCYVHTKKVNDDLHRSRFELRFLNTSGRVLIKAIDLIMEKQGVEELERTKSEDSVIISNGKDKEDTVSEENLRGRLIKKVSEITGIPEEKIDPHAQWQELGFDSILIAKFIREMHSEFGDYIYPNEIVEYNSIEKMVSYLIGELGESEDVQKETSTEEGIAAEAVLEPSKQETTEEKPIEHRKSKSKRPIVFLLSSPRAGSTLLRVMLMGHSKIFAPPELHLLQFKTMKQRREFAVETNQEFMTVGLAEAIKGLESVSSEEAIGRMQELEEQDLTTEETYRFLQELVGDRYLVDKSPSYGRRMENLERAERLRKNPFYIFLVRHPLSVVESFVRTRMYKLFGVKDNPWEFSDRLWYEMNTNIRNFLSKIPASRWIQIYYEKLVQSPEETMRDICEFLALKYEETMLHPYAKERTNDGIFGKSISIGDPNFYNHQGIDSSLAYAWQKHLDKVKYLSEQTKELAKGLGYALQ